ncbi:MAG TPA: tetratricopeptide repeat protein [Candidatus Obscuribacter sp.]|nr:tetratricopeptide repeat protein [Candidatus Obscuribacter sp.]HNH76446.1 tetratricopeptide repeat protein [Candidatus Obscuribacter sp.]
MKSKPPLPKVITLQLAVACTALGFFAYHPYAASAQEVQILDGAQGYDFASLDAQLALTPQLKRNEESATNQIATLSNCDPVVLNNQGVKAIVQGRYEDAIEHLQESLKLKPDYKIASGNLAIAYNNLAMTMKNKPDQAISYLELAVKYDSSNKIARKNLLDMQALKNKGAQGQTNSAGEQKTHNH